MNYAMRNYLLLLSLIFIPSASYSQAYPIKPIRFVIGAAPGTILDAVARPVAAEMTKQLGQPIVLEFKPGAGFSIAGRHVASAPPDGYTLYYGNSVVFNPVVKLNGVDAEKELTSISQFVSTPFFLMSRSNLPAKSLKEIAALSKPDPDLLKHATQGATQNLAMVLLGARTGISARPIPYSASSQSLIAILSGDVDLTLNPIIAFLPHIEKGDVRVLFVASDKRSDVAPSAPTTAELGMPEFVVGTNSGLWGPPGTPRAIVQRLSDAAAAAIKTPEITGIIRKAGGQPVGSTPEAQLQSFQAEMRFWREAAKLANFQPQ